MIRRRPDRQVRFGSMWSSVALPPLRAEEQQGFTAYFAEQTILSLLIAMPITALLHLFMIWLGINLFPEQKLMVAVYHLLVAIGAAALFLLARNPVTATYLPAAGIFIWLYVAALAAIAMVILEQGVYLYIGAVIFTLLYICGIIRATFQRAFICCAAGFLLVNLAMLVSGKRAGIEYLYANSFMLYAAVIGLTLSYTIERLERSKYLLQRRLVHEKAKSDDLAAWLRQLATFLRHEVRQPIAQINSSIELTALKGPGDAAFKTHLLDATNAAQHVWHLIDRASRATDAEAFVRESRSERVDLRKLLNPVVQGFAQTYSGVQFRLHAEVGVDVYADPVLLKEAVSNLLTNAASFADEDTVVEVSLQRHADRAQIMVRNQGPLIEGDTTTLFQPFASSRSDDSGEHHGLGLYLVRLIAQQHGGTAMIANSLDGEGVEASLLLPASNTSAR